MSEFKLPQISPLLGSSWRIISRVIEGNKVQAPYRLKVFNTRIVVVICSAFHWIDNLYFRRKLKSYSLAESPLFIIGHWRSGTTFLHNLLTKDPAAGYTTTYHAVFPNNLRSKWLFRTFMQVFMPDERPGDNMKISVSLPQEDEYAMSNISHRSFYHFFYFPTSYKTLYKEHIRFESLTEEEKKDWGKTYYQMVVKALLNTRGNRAILKNPVNTGRMLTLLDIFPEAKFVFIIRNPVIVYLSTRKFFSQLFPTLNLEIFTDEDISKMILEVYVELLQDYLADKKQLSSEKLIELRYEELVNRPLIELEEIYSKFSFGDFQKLKPVWQEYLDTLNGHKEDSYTIGQEELDRVMAHVDFAMEHWNYSMPENLKITKE